MLLAGALCAGAAGIYGLARYSLFATLFCPSRRLLCDAYHHGGSDLNINGIHAWVFSNWRGRTPKVVLFCHGNTGNISHRDYIIEICRRKRIDLLLFDYRGYGQTRGKPTLEGILRDGETVYEYLRQFYAEHNIVVWGESLGSIVATHLASKYSPCNLIIMSGIANLRRLLAECAGCVARIFLGGLVAKACVSDWMTRVRCGVFIIHSREDEVIGYGHAEENFAAVAHDNKRFLEIKGFHGTPIITDDILDEALRFCDMLCAHRQSAADILQRIAEQPFKHQR